ncbi:MAG TPA: fibronectin type III domain-containing protein [Thermoanaerobaculia bacterium]
MQGRKSVFLSAILALVFGAALQAQPAAPTNLQAVALSNTQIRLTWQDNATNEAEYRIEVRSAASSTFEDIGAVPANSTAVNVIGLSPSTTYFFRVRARNDQGFSPYSNVASATTQGGVSTCTSSPTVLCLNNGRFRVAATFRAPGGPTTSAQAVRLTDDTGYFWFFNAANVEVLVKVLNACSQTRPRYWVFAAGLTNVRVDIQVTDTHTGQVRTYTNPQGQAFQPIQDTSAFATCP